MSNPTKTNPFTTSINIKLYLIFALFLLALALLAYYNPIHFKGAKDDFPNLGDYDYQRTVIDGNPNYYELTIIPSRYGYIRAKRTVKAAGSDLAVRLGYQNVAILKIKKVNKPKEESSIIAQLYLYDARKGQKPPRLSTTVDAHDFLMKEPYPIFLENLL